MKQCDCKGTYYGIDISPGMIEKAQSNATHLGYENCVFTRARLLVKNGLIDIQIVEDFFAGRIIWYCETMQSQLNQLRKDLNDPALYDSIEYLYYEMKQRQQSDS